MVDPASPRFTWSVRGPASFRPGSFMVLVHSWSPWESLQGRFGVRPGSPRIDLGSPSIGRGLPTLRGLYGIFAGHPALVRDSFRNRFGGYAAKMGVQSGPTPGLLRKLAPMRVNINQRCRFPAIEHFDAWPKKAQR